MQNASPPSERQACRGAMEFVNTRAWVGGGVGVESSTAALQVCTGRGRKGPGEGTKWGRRAKDRGGEAGASAALGPTWTSWCPRWARPGPVQEFSSGPRKHSTAGTEDHFGLSGSLSPAAALTAVPSLRARRLWRASILPPSGETCTWAGERQSQEPGGWRRPEASLSP